ITLELPETRESYSLALPTHTLYGTIHAVTVDERPHDPKALNTVTGGVQVLISIPSGIHRVFVQYN
ncbi:MAG: hypothetical protein II180_11095, partial [Proteobacteria bacterium]|nr:hypothetical protein [Pseudomonadota bacterium]